MMRSVRRYTLSLPTITHTATFSRSQNSRHKCCVHFGSCVIPSSSSSSSSSYIRALSVFDFPWNTMHLAAVDSVALKFPLPFIGFPCFSLLSLRMHFIDLPHVAFSRHLLVFPLVEVLGLILLFSLHYRSSLYLLYIYIPATHSNGYWLPFGL
ncbi:hypothetical protein BYT27DRAFT_6457387 [Phlegmacium glaucopus]|nr:hypothetical protein BYT27DRAFT_6457387 [Phlegmacium glaucopus]